MPVFTDPPRPDPKQLKQLMEGAVLRHVEELEAERDRLREALEQIVRTIGPEVPDHLHAKCDGCAAEWGEALRVAREALSRPENER